ncbi:DUF4129 domain-containing protein [Lapillicoccus jejuensis]|nr:DUF4129 domain-containing protein [Lapillicoccus jejuensis]
MGTGDGVRGPSRLDVPRRTAVLAGLGALALLLLVLAVAGGPVDVVTGSGSLGGTAAAPPPVTPTSTTQTPTPTASGGDLAQQLPSTPPALGAAIRALLLVAVVVAAALLLRWLWRVVPRYRSRVQTGTVALEPPEADPEDIVAGADQRLALLLDGEPRNAIVACWVDLETAVERTGLERRPSETPTELTRRVLATWEVSPRHLDRLAELYREARFSRHPLHEGHREAAVHHLTALHDDLRRVAQRLADERERRRATQAGVAG